MIMSDSGEVNFALRRLAVRKIMVSCRGGVHVPGVTARRDVMKAGGVERRLAAILAADVAGYSRLMGSDEVATLRALKMHRRELIGVITSDKMNGEWRSTSAGDCGPCVTASVETS